jgi:hypothetical protein
VLVGAELEEYQVHRSASGCSELEELPSMETLTSLEELHIDPCVKLKSIQGYCS